MATDNPHGVRPITDDDETIRQAVRDAHLPTLMASLIHLTGSTDHLKGVTPVYEFFGDGQGDLTPQQREAAQKHAVEALKAYRDRGCTLAPSPDAATVRKVMNFLAGAEVPERYVPFLMEEMALDETDKRAETWADTVPSAIKENFRVVIIGAGMSGMLAAIRLKQAGIPWTIVEKNADVAGTWFENTYPGCRVDNPNHMYSYSFEPFHDWPQHYSTQDVLLSYFRRVADKYDLRQNIRFSTKVESAEYDEAKSVWHVRVKKEDGSEESLEANAVISAVGQLNQPRYPNLEGRDSFAGPSFHSARWDHSVDLKGKQVAVIGTGASAFQFVPEIAPDVEKLTVFQRTPPWLGPTPNYHDDVPEGMKWLLHHVPYYAQWYRFLLFWQMTDGIYEAAKVDPAWNGPQTAVSAANEELRNMLADYMSAQVADRPDLKDKVIPPYPPGGKRSVRDNGVWLSALKRDNVEVVTDPIERITPKGLVTKSGREVDVDVLIYGTGFHASHFLKTFRVRGRGDVELHEQWQGDARAYLGITAPNFPNFFMMYGPNTNIVVNGSIIFFSECETHYIMGCLKMLLDTGSAALECRKDVHDEFNRKIDAANEQMAWGVPQVSSWYKNDKGRVSQNWPFPLVDYWSETRAPRQADFVLTPKPRAVEAAE